MLPEGVVERGCELKEDPDDSCCKVMHCPAGSLSGDGLKGRSPAIVMEDLKTVQLPFDGCLFKNKTYAKDERYFPPL